MIGPVADPVAEAVVYACHGRWVAMCPTGCMNAEHYGLHETTPGRPGGLTDEYFQCSACGFRGPAHWPAKRADIERLLSLRPLAVNRNWLPGETVADLVVENLEHGIFDVPTVDARDEFPDGKVFQIVGDDAELGPAGIAAGMSLREIGGQ